MENKPKKNIYAFIDSQNLNLGTSLDIKKRGKIVYKGWKLDMKKFYKYLSDKFRVTRAFLFVGYIPQNKRMYDSFKHFGYELVFKPTVIDSEGKAKGNIDAEIVLYASCLKLNEYDEAVFVSGDGDFYCLYEFLQKKGKLKNIIIPNKYSESSLLNRFGEYKIFLYREKSKLERK
jgi:uncharacterized LabA/DUF88 family protein